MVKSWSRRAAALALASSVGSSQLPAQQYWPDRGEGTVVRADFLKPFFKGDAYQFLSGAVFFSVSGPVGKTLRLEADVPLARASFSIPGLSSRSSVKLGNPYVGMLVHREGRPLSGYLGLRLPLASSPSSSAGALALIAGGLADPDRFEAFVAKVFTVRGGVEMRSLSPAGLLLGAKLGPSLLVSTEGGDESELFADYGVRIGYQDAKVRTTVAITGRYQVTGDGASFSDRTEHVITGVVELRRGRVRPSALIRVPLDHEVREIFGATAGFGLAIFW